MVSGRRQRKNKKSLGQTPRRQGRAGSDERVAKRMSPPHAAVAAVQVVDEHVHTWRQITVPNVGGLPAMDDLHVEDTKGELQRRDVGEVLP